MNTQSAALSAHDLCVNLGGTPILHTINLTVSHGEVLALLGANGSGKSTLLRTLVGILPPTSGTACIRGIPAVQRAAHRDLGYVPQTTGETGNIAATAAETVATGLLGPSRWRASLRNPRIAAALDDVGMSHLASQPVTEMSGGQRQRIHIARALVRSPAILVLDEPFTGVDLDTQKSIADLLTQWHAWGTTIVTVLHELGPLADLVTRKVTLDAGSVISDRMIPATLSASAPDTIGTPSP
ncbi:metal ABC transporter ATP-binding protein [Devriesea agamarum]|uniref:metal ABC transporter ATP-binding protein n=1 Tax=Devriesea agamarum TaxID=472569 RepID=UPI00071C287A|nr:ATP-binding cassette domain-containing protein [Devriesea agamarum]